MGKLWILGAGQYGQAAREVAQSMGVYDEIRFLDDNSPMSDGMLADVEDIGSDEAFVAIGNPAIRKQWLVKAARPATLIHPRAVVMPSARIEAGCILEAGAVVCANAQVGMGCILMSNCVVGHDARVEDFCQLKYGCVIPERCVVPEKTKVDCNAVYGL